MNSNKALIKIITIFILIQPILDMLVTITTIPFSVIIRGLFLLFSIIYILKEKQHLKILLLIFFVSLMFLVYSYFVLSYGLGSSISALFKIIYLPIVILVFDIIKKDINLSKTLLFTLSLYIIIYLISYIFKFGYNNYKVSDGKTGYRGLFNSINEFSAILVSLYYIVFPYLKCRKFLQIIYTILLLIISFMTGTKVLLGGVIIILFLNTIPKLYKSFRSKSIKTRILYFVIGFILLLALGYLFTLTNNYRNMLVQAKFFNVNNIFSFEFINRVLFNNRLTFLINSNNYFIKQNIITQLFGIGYNHINKLVEIDIFDILYRYGLVIFISMVSFFIYCFKTINKSYKGRLLFVILIIISLTSGHVLLSPSVSIYFGIGIYIYKNNKINRNDSIS